MCANDCEKGNVICENENANWDGSCAARDDSVQESAERRLGSGVLEVDASVTMCSVCSREPVRLLVRPCSLRVAVLRNTLPEAVILQAWILRQVRHRCEAAAKGGQHHYIGCIERVRSKLVRAHSNRVVPIDATCMAPLCPAHILSFAPVLASSLVSHCQ